MFINKLKTLAAAAVILAALGAGTRKFTHIADAQGTLQSAKQPPNAHEKLRRAAADLAAAKSALAQLQAETAAAQERVAKMEAELELTRKSVNGSRGKLNASVAAALASQFKYRVPFEIGLTETSKGASIKIMEVWGTQPKITIGGLYLVRGKYRLSSQEHAKLYFYQTAKSWNNCGPTMDMQTVELSKGEGEFTLMHSMPGPGYFHLWLAGRDEGKGGTLANVYFGTGDNVLRK